MRISDWSSDVCSFRSVGAAVGAALEEVGLAGQADKLADELAHGDQRLLDFAIALAAQPRLLLLDEPTAGLSKQETRRVMEHIDHLRGRYTIILIEHKMDVVMTIRSEEHTSELQSLMRISYAVFCLKQKN